MKALSPPEAEQAWQDFCDLLDAVLSWHDGVAVVLAAYCDASVRDTGTLCVAALAFGGDRAKKMERDWRALFGDKACHMTDLHGRRGDFKDCSKDETTRLHRAAIGLMRRYVSFSVAYSLNLADETILPDKAAKGLEALLAGCSRGYPACINFAMVGLAELVRPSNANGVGMAYFIEEGDRFSSNAQRFILSIPKSRHKLFQYRSLTIAGKGDVRLLEAADMLAWEWAKHVDRVAEGKPSRPSLQAFVGERNVPIGTKTDYHVNTFKGLHLAGDRLKRWSERFSADALFAVEPA